MYMSPLVGIILELVMIRAFTAGGVVESFRALTTFMTVGQGVLTIQLLKYVLVPQLAKYHSEGRDREGLLFANHFTGFILLTLSPVLLYAVFQPEGLVRFLAPGFSSELVAESAQLARIAAVGLMLMILTGGISAVLNFHGVFWGQPLSQLLLNATIVMAILVGGHAAQSDSEKFFLLELSVSVGLGLMLALMLWQYLKVWRATDTRPGEYTSDVRLQGLLLAMLPQMVIIAAEITKPLVVNQTLSHLAQGSIVLYLLAFKLLMIGQLPIKAMVTVLFPSYSRLAADISPAQMASQVVKGGVRLFAVAAAIFLVLWVVAPLIIYVIAGLSNIPSSQESVLLDTFRVLVLFAPASALGLYFMETAFAFKKKAVVIGYCVISTAMLLLWLPRITSESPVAVAQAYAIVQAVSMSGLGVALYAALRLSARATRSADD